MPVATYLLITGLEVHSIFCYLYNYALYFCFFPPLLGRSSRENKVAGKLNNNTPAVPPAVKENELLSFRKSLPIYELREQILKLISENQVSQKFQYYCCSTLSKQNLVGLYHFHEPSTVCLFLM